MTEPRIEVGILHRKEIVFRLNGKFSVSPSDIITEGSIRLYACPQSNFYGMVRNTIP